MVAWTLWDRSYWPVSKLLPSLPPHPSPLTSYHAHQKDNDFSLIKQSLCHCLVSNYKASSVGASMVMQLRITFESACSQLHLDSVLPHFCIFWNWGVQNNSTKSPGTLGFQKDLCHQMEVARPFFLSSWPNWLRALPIYQLCEEWWFITRYSKDKSHLMVR